MMSLMNRAVILPLHNILKEMLCCVLLINEENEIQRSHVIIQDLIFMRVAEFRLEQNL